MEPITEDDAFIASALERAHLPSLMAALVHITGDASHVNLDYPLVYEQLSDMQGGIREADRQRIRERALEALRRLRDGEAGDPSVPPADVLRRMIDFVTGGKVPERYGPFLMDELVLGERTTDALAGQLAQRGSDGFRVAIIGAGMSGILAAYRMQQAGIDYVVLEKNDEVGGTWLENTYPGCRVDSSNHFYCYSFAPNHEWPQFFSTQPELLEYFRRCADSFGVREHIRFGTEVVEARYDEASCSWIVRVRARDGGEEALTVNAVISAVGQLNRPCVPDIPGRERFAGPAFHSARWRHDVDLRGKRVAVIGTGASAFQFVPEIADATASLRVFQRTPPWLMPTPHYHHDVPDALKWVFSHVPYYDRWYRFFLLWMSTEGALPAVTADEGFEGDGRSIGAANELARKAMTAYIRSQIRDDPGLQAAAVPSYPPGGKRMLRDNGLWLSTLQRDDVHLVTAGIESIDERGLRTSDGEHHEVDVLIYGTGFHASRFLDPIRIVGRGGVALADHWQGDARAYLGVTVPRFPNLFCIYGPNTNIVVNGSIIFFSECAVHYVLGCIAELLERGHGALEVHQDVHDDYNAMIDGANRQRAWGVPQVDSWYKNASGRVSQNWPYPLVDYWERTRAPARDDFRWTSPRG